MTGYVHAIDGAHPARLLGVILVLILAFWAALELSWWLSGRIANRRREREHRESLARFDHPTNANNVSLRNVETAAWLQQQLRNKP